MSPEKQYLMKEDTQILLTNYNQGRVEQRSYIKTAKNFSEEQNEA